MGVQWMRLTSPALSSIQTSQSMPALPAVPIKMQPISRWMRPFKTRSCLQVAASVTAS